MILHAQNRRGLVPPLAASVVAASLAVGIAPAPAQATPAGDNLVITEAYLRGGSAGATYVDKFVEVYNPTDGPITLDGLSVQYRSSGGTGNATSTAAMTGTLAADDYYVITGGSNGSVGAEVPNADLESGLNFSGSSGTIFITSGTSATTPDAATVIDKLGYGSSNSPEGTAASVTTDTTAGPQRDADGTDTDDNSVDFSMLPSTPGEPVAAVTEPEVTEATIAEIQGPDDAAALAGETVVTEGVVTAVYPGSLNGFVIQTGGTGGDPADDATPGVSDGIFVYAGSSFDGTGVAIGDSKRVTGSVSDYFGKTQITSTEVVDTDTPLEPVTATVTAYPTTADGREALESMLLSLTDDFTVTNVYNTNRYAEIGLATGDTPLIQPTEVEDFQTGDVASIEDDNFARGVILDDGASLDFLSSDNQGTPLPWLSANNPVRVGAAATFTGDVILDYGFSAWRLQPTEAVTDEGADVATFENTRPANASPADVGGDLVLGTFNVLNYFNTTGVDYVAAGGECTYYNDRDGEPVGTNRCGSPSSGSGNGPRGAADEEDFLRQQAKIVGAINEMDADIVSLEEIENSVALLGETDRDDALSALVDALNADAGTTRWAYAPSPAAADLPAVEDQDVIRTAFIYDPSTVTRVGPSRVLVGDANFDNAREPLAQAFKPVGSGNADVFAVIVNHLKSKSTSGATGDNVDTGQGGYNGDRTRQAESLVTFADTFGEDRGTDKVFLTGDFNSYTMEDPMQVLYDAGFTQVDSDTADEWSYSFSGLSGSLDHVLATDAALGMVTGADIWEINANESVAFQYSRYNYNVTDFYADDVFAASDHNPEIVGLATEPPSTTEVQLLATNDFHGRIQANRSEAGAAVLAGAVKQLRSENPNTVFAAAGDLIGASTFESFIAQDKPTIDALNEAGLEVSAVGNHEFDKGYDDLVGRVMAPYDADTNPYGGAEWEYLGANVKFKESGDPALDGTWIKEMDGVQVGFVGAVTEHLDELVSPAGITDIEVTDIVEATNAAADDLKSEGADIVVLLVHEGAPSNDCDEIAALGAETDFGSIVQGVSDDVDAIVSGHTHLTYNCSFPVAGWSDREVTERPVVSAGQYGYNLNQILFSVDEETGEVVGMEQNVLPLTIGVDPYTANYPEDQDTQDIVDAAVAEANVLGAVPLGEIDGAFYRAKLANGTTENRGGESTAGNLVAEIQRWATSTEERGAAQIAFMNPGGLRADLVGQGSDAFPRTVTYKDAANVQPFANTLVNMDLTGEQLASVLEEQWQPDGASRPFLKLGISEGFTYTYDPTAAAGEHITAMYLDGEPIDPAASYSVTVNSFLAAGGDDFATFEEGAEPTDTGYADLQAQVDYFEEFASETPIPVDYSQRAVGVVVDEDPEVVRTLVTAGDDVTMELSSLSMTGPGDLNDTSVEAFLGDVSLGTFPVTTTRQTALPGYDEAGTASVRVTVPADTESGDYTVRIVGADTGTEALVPLEVEAAGPVEVQLLATNDFHGRIQANRSEAGAAVLAGAVKQLRSENPNTVFAAAGDLIGASTFESFIAQDKPTIDALNEAGLEVSAVGNHEFDKGYDDLVGRVMAPYDADTNPYGGAEWEYLGANVKFKESGDPALDGTWIKEMDGVQVGFVGAVTEHLDELVSPAGITDIEVTDIVEATNAAADDLKSEGADIVVLLVHEGAPSNDCDEIAALGAETDFGSIVQGVSDDVDAIVSGHTHLTYNCSFPVAGWSDREVTERPVVSAGQYGYNLNQILFSVDEETGEVVGMEQNVLPLTIGVDPYTANYPADQDVQDIVDAAVAEADVLGAEPLGDIDGAFYRAKLENGTTENRGGESTLGNLVAEIQQWATSTEERGSAQIAFMNPGGLRADLTGSGDTFPKTVTYKQAANVQPFANTLVNMDLTGEQLKDVLEEQWQPDGASRPFLKLGISEGFTYLYDPTAPAGEHILQMRLDGEVIGADDVFSVTVNSFLAAGGDDFDTFAEGADARDTGYSDLQAQVDYFAEFATEEAVPVDYSQRAVGMVLPDDWGVYEAGDTVDLELSSLSMTGPGDLTDSEVSLTVFGTELGSGTVETVKQSALPGFDEAGTSSASLTIPDNAAGGLYDVTIEGPDTGTAVTFTMAVEEAPDTTPPPPVKAPSVINVRHKPAKPVAGKDRVRIIVNVASEGRPAQGRVVIKVAGRKAYTMLLNRFGRAVVKVPPFGQPGRKQVTVTYNGNKETEPNRVRHVIRVVR